MLLVGSVMFIVLSLSAMCNAENPGIKVRIPQKVLEEGVQYLVNTMTEEISIYNLPDVNGSATIDSDEMAYELTKIKIVDLQFGNISSTYVPGSGAQISLQRGSAVIHCECNLDSWLIKDSGSAVLTLSGTSIIMILGVRRIDPGVPLAFMLDCQSSIKHIDFKIQSGISYVYDALKPHIEEVLQRSVTQQLCSALRSQVFRWNRSLANLKLNFTLAKNVKVDLSLISDPEISENYADLKLKGQFHVPNVTVKNYSPAPITFPDQASSRSFVGISEASVNSLVAAHYLSGSMNAMISNVLESINLTTSELTTAVPEISKDFESPTPAKIILYATSSPKIYVKTNNITMEFQGHFQINTKPAKGKSQCLLETTILAVLNGDISISDTKKFQGLNVSASISLHRFQTDKIKTNSCKPKYAASEKDIQHIVSHILLENINEKLKEGMPIPSRILKNPTGVSKHGYELMETDISWD